MSVDTPNDVQRQIRLRYEQDSHCQIKITSNQSHPSGYKYTVIPTTLPMVPEHIAHTGTTTTRHKWRGKVQYLTHSSEHVSA